MDVNTDLEPMVFKAQLYALTGVQPARQKVMLKGQTLKDNDWGNIQITNVSIKLPRPFLERYFLKYLCLYVVKW